MLKLLKKAAPQTHQPMMLKMLHKILEFISEEIISLINKLRKILKEQQNQKSNSIQQPKMNQIAFQRTRCN